MKKKSLAHVRMMSLLGLAFLLQSAALAAPYPQANNDETVLIECSSVRARTHVYQVISFQRRFYFDVISQNGHPIQRILINPPYIFGDTFIVTAPKGPGGYVHLYHSGRTSLIDINLTDNTTISTREALTDYQCRQLE